MWEMESQRVAFGETLVELGKERADIVVLSADLASSTKSSMFAKEFPERFFNMGVAEQNMMGVAAGLAASGKIVFVTTFSVFATGRAYDQVRQSIAYPMLNVKIVASHGGITVGPDGATHQITEDLALMSVLPQMTVVVPADAVETRKAVRAAVEMEGPIYIRLGRANVPTITRKDDPFTIGRATVLRDGSDVALIGTGVMVSECLKAAEALRKKNIDAMVINMSTIKPLDDKTIIKAADKTGAIVTAEEHNITMGMGTAIAMVLSEHRQVPMHLVGIPDVFGESGEPEDLMKKYGLTMSDIVRVAEDVVARKGKRVEKKGLLKRGIRRIIRHKKRR